jgi:iron complex outermembrane receptor protein
VEAQTTLPGIVVTTPSPLAKSRRPATPAEAPRPGASEIADLPPVAFPVASGLLVADDAFVSVTVVAAPEILANGGATLTDMLQTRPGIAGSTFAAGANRPIIRGLDNYRVRVQENGIGTHDVSALSEDHAVPVDPFSAERVEVVHGPATLRYGGQAIGGVVAIENDRIPTFSPPRGFAAEMRGGFSSVDDGRDGAFKATAGAAGVVVHADAFRRHADDYRTPRGRQANTFVDSEGWSVGSSYVWDRGHVGVAFARIGSLYGIPGEEAQEARPRIDLEQDKILSKGEWRVGGTGVAAVRYWFGSSNYAHNEVVFEAVDGVDTIGSRFTNREQEGRVEIEHTPAATGLGELRGAIGAQIGHRQTRGQSFEGDPLLDPATTRSIAGFWFEELQLNRRLRLQAAARVEHTEIAGTGLVDFADPLSPTFFQGARSFKPRSASLGLLQEVPLGVVARLTGQYVERAPDASELFSKGAHEATGTFEVGNPGLRKEGAATVELGLKRATGGLRFDASAYYTKFDGFIFKDLTGIGCGNTIDTCGVEDELDQVRFGQRDATFYGGELAAQYDVAPIWRGVWGLEGQYDFVRAEFSDGTNVPRIPPHRVGGGLFYRDPIWFARVGVLHAFRQDRIATTEIETPGYTLVSAEASYTMKRENAAGGAPELTIGIKGENLADDDVLNHASFKRREEVLLPGASVRVFGSIKLN